MDFAALSELNLGSGRLKGIYKTAGFGVTPCNFFFNILNGKVIFFLRCGHGAAHALHANKHLGEICLHLQHSCIGIAAIETTLIVAVGTNDRNFCAFFQRENAIVLGHNNGFLGQLAGYRLIFWSLLQCGDGRVVRIRMLEKAQLEL